MRPFDDSLLTPDERRAEVASILAAGVLRLSARAALPGNAPELPATENQAESTSSCLEVSDETVLSVHNGYGWRRGPSNAGGRRAALNEQCGRKKIKRIGGGIFVVNSDHGTSHSSGGRRCEPVAGGPSPRSRRPGWPTSRPARPVGQRGHERKNAPRWPAGGVGAEAGCGARRFAGGTAGVQAATRTVPSYLRANSSSFFLMAFMLGVAVSSASWPKALLRSAPLYQPLVHPRR